MDKMASDAYDSEHEDNPRLVLDLDGDFTLLGADPPIVFKLNTFTPQVRLANDEVVPFKGVLSTQPVPSPFNVTLATQMMGSGEHGVWTGTQFVAPADANPEFVFPVRQANASASRVIERFCIRRRFVPQISGLKTMAIYTDGACSNNVLPNDTSRGGYAFVFKPSKAGSVASAVERRGPDGQVYPHTSNRAELRAVIAALKFRIWWGEGWNRIVIITDSEYVGKGATEWMRNWKSRDWRTAAGKPVANKDLWGALSEALGYYATNGCEISFWVIPRAWNTIADAAAKEAARKGDGADEYTNMSGVGV